MQLGGGTMKTQNMPVLVVLLAAALLAAILPQRSSGAGRGGSAAPVAAQADVIVRFAPSVAPVRRRAAVRAAGGSVTRDLHLIDGLGARMTPAAAGRLRAALGVRSVSFAAPVQSRGNGNGNGDDGGPLNAFAAAIGAPKLWDDGHGLTGRRVGVAVIDTGIAGQLTDFDVSRINHRSRVVASAVINPEATGAEDRYGHGTHVAGIIAGDGSNRRDARRDRYSGVAPDAKLVSIKISDDDGRATTLDAIYGIQFAVDHADELGIRIINLSLSSSVAESPTTDPLDAAVEAAWLQGQVVVAAAGNDGGAPKAVSYAPGNDPYVITVGATDDEGTDDDADDDVAPWSSHGHTQTGVSKPEVMAPGSHIVSTLARDSVFERECPECVVDRHYFRAGGTSMATAVVSGAVALLLEDHPDWNPDQVKAALISTAAGAKDGHQIRVDKADGAKPSAEKTKQTFRLNRLVDAATGTIDYTAASWRAASWRSVQRDDPYRAGWAAASWRCDCSLADDGSVDPQAASWRAASWRTSFTK
ncbi:MAG: serine protease AprX [Solirubrobacteraceae bacterium]|jgi:serine protease AprX|nr:serine protease AprX [Solirubrobacteraceae bacterium]